MNTKELQEAVIQPGESFQVAYLPMRTSPIMVGQERFKILNEAAQKLLSLYPLLEELCEARGKAAKGIWQYHTDKPTGHFQIAITAPDEEFNIGGVCLGLVDSDTWDGGMFIQKENRQALINAHFITTAANTTNQIRKVLDE